MNLSLLKIFNMCLKFYFGGRAYMGKVKRKPRPQPAKWYWWANDGCYGCKNRNNCNQCKALKEQMAYEREKRERKHGRYE